MSNSIIEAIRNYMVSCPLLDEFARINVDYLGDEPTEYTIDSVPGEPVLQRYVNGDSKRQLTFVFASRESYGPDVLQNMENSGFYERLVDWFEEQSWMGNLPLLPIGKESIDLRATTHGYTFQTDFDSAQYQIQCRLTYFQKGV